MRRSIGKNVERALLTCARILDGLDADWAIGGAIAMGAQGYRRATEDVDVFIGDDAREELLAKLDRRGLRPVPTMEPMHYSIIPDRRTPDARVDLLFPALGVESLALLAAKRAPLFGARLPVWPLEHIAAHKLITDPRLDPARATRDQADLQQLRDRGLIDVDRVTTLLRDVRDAGARRRLAALMRGA